MKKHQPKDNYSTGYLTLDLLLAAGGRAALGVGDTLVSIWDGVKAIHCSLYYSRLRNTSLAPKMGKAAYAGVSTVIRNGIRYHRESTKIMNTELEKIFRKD